MPRLAGQADVLLWQRLLPDRAVFGQRTPVWVRSTNERGRRILGLLGAESPAGTWRLVHWDGARLMSAVDAGEGIELQAARAHRPLLDRSLPEIGADTVQRGQGL